MPSAHSDIHTYQISLLKEATEKKFGFAVCTKTDCDKLADTIENKTKQFISVNTLRRFFEVMPSESKPSLETLNILSRFCGFNDFYDFKKSHILNSSLNGSDLSIDAIDDLQQALGESPRFYSTFNWLMLLAFRENNTQFLKDIFNAECLRNSNDYPREMHRNLILTFSNELRRNPQLFELLVPHYAKQPAAQALYFEWFVDYDYLNIHHHNAIRAYASERSDDDARLFSLCILFLHHFWLLEKNECEQLIKKINQIELKPETHPFPAGRKFACNILFESLFRKGLSKTYESEIESWEKQLPREGNLERNLPSFHLMVVEAFNMVGLHEAVLHYSELARKNYSSKLTEYSKGVLIPLTLYHARALAGTNRNEEAKEKIRSIDITMIDDSHRDFHRMHYHKIVAATSKQNSPEFRKSTIESKRIARQHRFLFF